MTPRATLIACALDLALWALIVAALSFGAADPATEGLDTAATVAITILLGLTAVPALLLARARRALILAFAFALAFPAALLMLVALVAFSLP